MTSLRSSRHVRLGIGLVAAVALFGLRAPAQSPPLPTQYGVMTLPTLGGAQAAAYDLSDDAHMIVGRGQTASGAYHAFGLGYQPLTDFGTLGGGDSTAFAADRTLIVGQSQTTTGAYHAFSVDNTGLKKDLGTLGGNFSAAYDVQDSFIVGSSRVSGNTRQRAFQYVNGTMSPVDVDTGGDSAARGTNFLHDIVGYTCTVRSTGCRPFLFSGGSVTLLGSAMSTGVANRINYGRQVVGSLSTTGSATHAFLYGDGVLTDLGTLGGPNSEARGINYFGDVVGTAQNATGLGRAFIWHNGNMIDLNTLIVPGSGWVLESAAAISDGGQIAGYGTLKGKRRAFLLTPATDMALVPWGVRSESDSNAPPDGIEVGHHVTWVTSAQGLGGSGAVIFGARIVHTLTGPAQFVTGDSPYYGDTCDVTPTMVTCYLTPIDTVYQVNETRVKAKATGPGPITHHATFFADTPDPHPENNSISEQNRAVALSDFTISPATNAGGQVSTGNLVLTDTAALRDSTVTLTNSRPDIVTLPPTIEIPFFRGSKSNFHIIPNPVTSPTTVQLSATYGLVTVTKTLTVVPSVLRQLYLTPTTVVGGCGSSAGRVLLTGIPPTSGGAVPLANTNVKAMVPARVTVLAGTTEAKFTVPTTAVTANTSGTVTAAFGGVSQALTFTVRPLRAQVLSLSSNSVRGGATVSGTVTLECPAAPGAVVVSLTSSNTAVAVPTAPSITLAAGTTIGSFSVKTSAVSSVTPVTITARVFGVTKAVSLTVTP